MPPLPIYMDNHGTTRTDPRVLAAMLPYFGEEFGNAGSTSHVFGWAAKQAVDDARETISAALGAAPREIIFTSGATESNNLAIRGVAAQHARRGRHLVSVATEHPSVLEPLARLRQEGFETTLVPVRPAGDPLAGRVVPEQLAAALRDDTILVSVMLANHEIGVVQPLAEIAALCHARGVLLHTDATQAVGKLPVCVEALGVDLMSFSGHKLYGPKGVGGLYVRRRTPAVKLRPIIEGGGQEFGLRSGTLNTPGIVGFARAVEICLQELPAEAERLRQLRGRLWDGLRSRLEGLTLNGPELGEHRLPGNLNVSFALVDGEALLLSMKDLAVSSGSACASAEPEPSHVLLALGLDKATARGSLRFGLGRFNTDEEVDYAVNLVAETVARLRASSTMA